MSVPRVFISMGTPYTPELLRFRDELETFLRDQCRVDPRIIGKNEYPSGSPLAKIRDVMRQCNGVLIVAYERKHLAKGAEKRGSEAEMALANRTYTTPWNHIESAIAFSLNLPLHIICQKGLAEEGLIETKVDWYVQKIEFTENAFRVPQVAESLRAWVETRVKPHSRTPRFIRTLLGQSRLSDMTPAELWAAVAVLATAFGLGVAAAQFFPRLFGGP